MSGRARRRFESRPLIDPVVIPQARGTIRGRLLRILAVPLVVVVVLLGVVINRDLTDYNTARETTDAVRLVLAAQDLVQDLQTERGLTSGFLGGDVGFQKEMVASRSTVDSERATLATLLAAATQQSSAGHQVLTELDGTISATRDQIDNKKIDRTAAFDYFTTRIAQLNAVNFGLDSSTDRDLRRGVGALTALATVKEQYAQERALLNGVFSAGGYVAGEYSRYALIVATKTQALATFDADATAGQKWLKDYALDTGAAREAKFFEDRALADPSSTFKVQTNPQSWWSAFTTVLDDLRTAQEAVGSDISAIARGLRDGATRRLSILAGLAILGALGAGLVLVISAQSITRPLRALVREAEGLAQHRLPEAVARAQGGHDELAAPLEPVAVPPGASSEVLSLVGALERVQNTAYLLATEQATLRRSTAESLANLGRRNQNLLRRQLSFITRLEQEESDPQGLANLFELDHLATRMRRNAESLLVLVGESTPRRWAAPLPIADVIRAAISEVEEYRRVSLKRIDDGWVGGAYVAGIAHMIAELVENGLSFSPPDLDVEIQGRNLGGRYLIAVTDQGVGMDQMEMERANARLRGEENYLSVPTRFLGHYVVGHLAEQMRVEVEISPSPVTGITARVTLPSTVLAQPPALAAGGPGLGAATASTQSRAGASARAQPARAAAQVDEAQIVGEGADGWEPVPTRALGSRPVVEYVPMSTATGTFGHATGALPLVEAVPGRARPAEGNGAGWNGGTQATAAPTLGTPGHPDPQRLRGSRDSQPGYREPAGYGQAEQPGSPRAGYAPATETGYDSYGADPLYGGDPRYPADPRYAGDPRYSGDPRQGGESRHGGDSRYGGDGRYGGDDSGYYAGQQQPSHGTGYDSGPGSSHDNGYGGGGHDNGYDSGRAGGYDNGQNSGYGSGYDSGYDSQPAARSAATSAAPAGYESTRTGYPEPEHAIERTQNGLVKRVARSRAGGPEPAPSAPAERYAPMDGSPDSVRSRLTSLRAGMARGEGERGGHHPTHPDQHR